ncbi:MAG: UDP-N-acetylmuramoyl-L-alanyl-D-glutamate--2,6-diaminopimelate ligase [Clostridia bacterium]|nr:UDP-N-acetylmuramoyl-L-alanyl-D-glutamate--2,6-diaminopimelate ligase [Clostridia bacterium]
MLLSDILKEKSGKFADLEITGVTCDSRKVGKGSVFVCINGALDDGHKYARSAYDNGAAVIICEKDTGLPNQIFTEDSRKEYARLSANWFSNPAKNLKIIGVTGTNGKTSVSYMIKEILENCGHKVGLVGTIQNMIGDEVLPSKNTTPSCYELQSMFSLMVAAGCDYCVMEVSSHALDQDRVYGIEFEAGIFTNLTQDHLDYHITMDNYLKAKKRLFDMSKVAIMNSDDSYFEMMSQGLENKIVTFSAKNNKSDYNAKNISLKPDGSEFDLVSKTNSHHIKTAIGGKFTPYNAMAAAVCLIELGFSFDAVSNAFEKMKGVKGRAEVVPCDRDFTIIVDYAHTHDGHENILKTFSECDSNRRIVLFGCGGDRDRTKRPKMGAIAVENADYVIVTSDNPRSEEPIAIINDILEGMKNSKTPYEVIENRIEAIKKAVQIAEKGDIIVLAGKGHETYQILKDGTIHLDEREIVAEALQEL